MESMQYPFASHDFNVTFLKAILHNICSNGTSSTGGLYVWHRIVVDVHIVGLLCLVGFVGNALTIAVLYRDRQDGSSATNWLLRTLAGVDTFYLIACLFIQTFKTAHDLTDWFPAALKPYFPYAERFMWPIASIGQTVTVWTVLLVTVDRYLAVCRPFDARMRSVERTKKFFVGVLVGAVLYNIPLFLERNVVVEPDHCTNQEYAKVVKTSLRDNERYYIVYKICFYLVFRTVGPLVTLLVLNVFLIRALHATRRRHQKISSATSSSRRSKHRENVTLILVVVVSVFIVCQIPDLGLRITVAAGGQSAKVPGAETPFLQAPGNANEFTRFINSITNVLLTLNSAVNFLIYCLLGKKFRRIFVEMFCCWSPNHGGHKRHPYSMDRSNAPTAGHEGSRRMSPVPSRAVPGTLVFYLSFHLTPRLFLLVDDLLRHTFPELLSNLVAVLVVVSMTGGSRRGAVGDAAAEISVSSTLVAEPED